MKYIIINLEKNIFTYTYLHIFLKINLLIAFNKYEYIEYRFIFNTYRRIKMNRQKIYGLIISSALLIGAIGLPTTVTYAQTLPNHRCRDCYDRLSTWSNRRRQRLGYFCRASRWPLPRPYEK